MGLSPGITYVSIYTVTLRSTICLVGTTMGSLLYWLEVNLLIGFTTVTWSYTPIPHVPYPSFS